MNYQDFFNHIMLGIFFPIMIIGAFFFMFGAGPLLTTIVKDDIGFLVIGIVLMIPGIFTIGLMMSKKIVIHNAQIDSISNHHKSSFFSDENKLFQYLTMESNRIKFHEIESKQIQSAIEILGISQGHTYNTRLVKAMELKQEFLRKQVTSQ